MAAACPFGKNGVGFCSRHPPAVQEVVVRHANIVFIATNYHVVQLSSLPLDSYQKYHIVGAASSASKVFSCSAGPGDGAFSSF